MGRRDSNFTFKLTEDEWEKLIAMHKFLEVFYEVTCLFSGTLYPTANVYFRGVWKVHTSLLEVLRGKNNFMMDMVKDMYAKFSKYWSDYSLVLSCAAILDPRYKVKLVAYCYAKLYGEDSEQRVNTIVSTLHKLFDEYMEHGTSSSLGTSSGCVLGANEGNRMVDDGFEDYDTFQGMTYGSQLLKSQLDLYLEEPCFPLKHEMDILDHFSLQWRMHHNARNDGEDAAAPRRSLRERFRGLWATVCTAIGKDILIVILSSLLLLAIVILVGVIRVKPNTKAIPAIFPNELSIPDIYLLLLLPISRGSEADDSTSSVTLQWILETIMLPNSPTGWISTTERLGGSQMDSPSLTTWVSFSYRPKLRICVLYL
ncbi:hypothetical protein Vadar_007856 [Vaccinium darrowii]|uniref:Uncharacterized protein n=1 Tax=Vaccinium darrowii TaxID=229202 RepID=A0ACB7Y5C8_9ERIC|nr:hypothetical protein Vadar_007856 [Vaccinium darrowii]